MIDNISSTISHKSIRSHLPSYSSVMLAVINNFISLLFLAINRCFLHHSNIINAAQQGKGAGVQTEAQIDHLVQGFALPLRLRVHQDHGGQVRVRPLDQGHQFLSQKE